MRNKIKEFEVVRQWATERGLYEWGDVKSQTIKLGEEYGELCRGIMKQDKSMVKDALGDMLVVLINASHLAGFSMEECLAAAWDEIKDRQGSMKGGTFVKEATELFPGTFENLGKINVGYSTHCPKCSMDLSKPIGYVCGDAECPVQTRFTNND